MNFDALPDFPLAPWELPPNSTEPLVAPTTLRWHGSLGGRTAEWLMRLVVEPDGEAFLVNRAASSPEEASWWYYHFDYGLFQFVLERMPKNLSSLPPRAFHRSVHLCDREKNWHIVLGSEGHSVVGLLDERKVRFSFEWPFDFTNATTSQVHDEVVRVWNDEDSDLSFARRWLLLSEDEQYALMMRWPRGSEADFLRVMGWVLVVFGPRTSSNPLRWWFHPIKRKFALAHAEVRSDLSNPEQPFERKWGKAMVEVYAPTWNEELAQTRACTRSLDNFSDRLCVFVDLPSAHEQLEAARELAAWLDEREARNELPAPLLAPLRATLG